MEPTYLILGATGGIGSALARRLKDRGARLALLARREAPLADLGSALGALTVAGDATSFETVDDAVRRTVEELGGLDGIVNCVGSILLKPAHRTSPEEWHETLRQNLDTAFATVRAGTAAMQKRGGSIVLLSSAAARLGLASHEAVAAAKAGVVGLARAAAASYASRGIRVNVVAPGLVRTELSKPVIGSEVLEKASTAMHPLGRLGEPEDVASAIDWLLDARQSWVTGQELGVDGGLGTVRSRG